MSSPNGSGENRNRTDNTNANNVVQIIGALPCPEAENRNNTTVAAAVEQPRQPSNLQGLLRFCVETTRREDAHGQSHTLPMDEERKRWLENALQSMTEDVITTLLRSVETLKKAGDIRLEDDPSEFEKALETIGEYVDNIDTANDFYKIGGFSIFQPCLNCVHSSVRWRTADIIAEIHQNNPFCQSKFLDFVDLLPALLLMLDKDPSDQVKTKALYALSCIIRDNPQGLQLFSQHDGFSILLRALQSRVEKLIVKSSFLLTSLCSKEPWIKDTLCEMGFVEQFVALLQQEHSASHEHVMSALLALVTEHPPSQEQCRRIELQLLDTLQQRLRFLRGKDEFREELEYALEILNLIFRGDGGQDR